MPVPGRRPTVVKLHIALVDLVAWRCHWRPGRRAGDSGVVASPDDHLATHAIRGSRRLVGGHRTDQPVCVDWSLDRSQLLSVEVHSLSPGDLGRASIWSGRGDNGQPVGIEHRELGRRARTWSDGRIAKRRASGGAAEFHWGDCGVGLVGGGGDGRTQYVRTTTCRQPCRHKDSRRVKRPVGGGSTDCRGGL